MNSYLVVNPHLVDHGKPQMCQTNNNMHPSPSNRAYQPPLVRYGYQNRLVVVSYVLNFSPYHRRYRVVINKYLINPQPSSHQSSTSQNLHLFTPPEDSFTVRSNADP